MNNLGDKKLVYFQNGYGYKYETTSKRQGNSLCFRWKH
jgi:hypothetical protein